MLRGCPLRCFAPSFPKGRCGGIECRTAKRVCRTSIYSGWASLDNCCWGRGHWWCTLPKRVWWVLKYLRGWSKKPRTKIIFCRALRIVQAFGWTSTRILFRLIFLVLPWYFVVMLLRVANKFVNAKGLLVYLGRIDFGFGNFSRMFPVSRLTRFLPIQLRWRVPYFILMPSNSSIFCFSQKNKTIICNIVPLWFIFCKCIIQKRQLKLMLSLYIF